MKWVKRIAVIMMVTLMFSVYNYSGSSNATFISTSTTENYTDPLYGYDQNGSYYIVQSSNFRFSGYNAGIWPSDRTITYTPYKTNYDVAAAGLIISGVGTSATIYYNQGCAYLNSYRIGAHTNTGTATSYFQFFV